MESKFEDISARAVVVGCSHTDTNCDHQIHPSPKDFFTIDILGNPDLLMDITKGDIPEALKGKFQLTILEFLPFPAYNYDYHSFTEKQIDGRRGFNTINELTADNRELTQGRLGSIVSQYLGDLNSEALQAFCSPKPAPASTIFKEALAAAIHHEPDKHASVEKGVPTP